MIKNENINYYSYA